MLPTHSGQTVVSVAAGYFVEAAVLDGLRNHQQAWVTDGERQNGHLKTKYKFFEKGLSSTNKPLSTPFVNKRYITEYTAKL